MLIGICTHFEINLAEFFPWTHLYGKINSNLYLMHKTKIYRYVCHHGTARKQPMDITVRGCGQPATACLVLVTRMSSPLLTSRVQTTTGTIADWSIASKSSWITQEENTATVTHEYRLIMANSVDVCMLRSGTLLISVQKILAKCQVLQGGSVHTAHKMYENFLPGDNWRKFAFLCLRILYYETRKLF